MSNWDRAQRRAEFTKALKNGNKKAETVLQAAQSATVLNSLRRRAFWMGFGDGVVVGFMAALGFGAVLAYYGVL